MKQASLSVMALATLLSPALLRSQGSDCAALQNFKLPDTALTITKAEAIPTTPANTLKPFPWMDAIPVAIGPYCRVDGEMEPRTGVGGKRYAIGFAIALPDNWNGRFLFQGGGGLNGSVGNPLGMNAAGDVPALARGFAVVATDTGHKGEGFDASFFRDQEAALNFAYLAVGKVAVAARAIIAARYGRQPKYSYFSGCSTGGREGMLMTQRYPTYFDGVISGAPAMRTDYSGLGDQWVAVALNQIAPKNAAGKTLPAFNDSERKLIVGALLKQCDAKDGVSDGMIFDTQGCRFDPTPLACQGGKTDACLTNEQVTGLQKAFAGPKDSRGNPVYPGFPFDTGITSTAGIPGLLVSSVNPVGPPFTATEMDVDAAVMKARSNPAGPLTATTWTNLSTYSAHNGKLLFYHGMSDPWFSAWDTLDYYQNMAKANGGIDKTLNWSRMYLVPGMGHCSGGAAALDNFDLLTPLVDWVEKGEAPASVTAKGKAFPKRTRPLCAYPTHAQYKGQGDPEDSRNFDCVQ